MLVIDRQMAVHGEKTQSPNGSKPEEFDVVILGGAPDRQSRHGPLLRKGSVSQ
jgi:hypothetical protein